MANSLGSLATFPSVPVVSHQGRIHKGQIRDKFALALFASLALAPFWLLAAIAENTQRQRPRSRAEIDAERRARFLHTTEEIDSVYRDYLKRIGSKRKGLGAAYARYSTRFQDSIADQIRVILEFAAANGIFVARNMIFFDLAVRGITRSRAGLDELRQVLKQKRVGTLLLFKTNRLFRKRYRTIAFVDQVLRAWRIRCVFVAQKIDTNDKKQWEHLLELQSLFDQFVVTANVENIHAAHIGMMTKTFVFGTLSYGYAGKPIPGQLTKRGKPRCEIVIDPETAEIVRNIFHWFVIDRLTIMAIVRRLNANPSIPLPPKCVGGEWTRLAVRGILRNSRYRSLWRYGVTESTYLPEEDYTRQIDRAEPLHEILIPQLRIVPDDIWALAQLYLCEERNHGGRRAKNRDKENRPRVLNGLLYCPVHDRPLIVGKAYGRYMYCPRCDRMLAEERPLYTQLNRKLALQLVCDAVIALLRIDDDMVRAIIVACQAEVEAVQRPDTKHLESLKREFTRLTRAIDLTRRTAGETESDQREAEQTIRTMQAERQRLSAELQLAEAAANKPRRVPTPDEIRALLARLHDVLRTAATSEDPATVQLARDIIRRVTGGRIDVFQCGDRKPRSGYLEARFRPHVVPAVMHDLNGLSLPTNAEADEVVIAFKAPPSFEAEADLAHKMEKAGALGVEIGEALGCSRAKVTNLLKFASKKHGEDRIDGRVRRHQLSKKQRHPTRVQQVEEKVMTLWHAGFLNEEIAEKTNVCRDTITHIVRSWHEKNGLPVPDGRTRRKSLSKKSRDTGKDE